MGGCVSVLGVQGKDSNVRLYQYEYRADGTIQFCVKIKVSLSEKLHYFKYICLWEYFVDCFYELCYLSL